MIIDRLKNSGIYMGLGPGVSKALRYLRKTDFLKMGPGRYEVEGQSIYAIIQRYETKPVEKGVWEAHRKYIDVQYMLKGSELMGYACLSRLRAGAYDEEKDSVTLAGSGEFILVREGDFILFTPEDAHMPGLSEAEAETVLKAVLKVRIEAV